MVTRVVVHMEKATAAGIEYQAHSASKKGQRYHPRQEIGANAGITRVGWNAEGANGQRQTQQHHPDANQQLQKVRVTRWTAGAHGK
jgi:hypothetical protein